MRFTSDNPQWKLLFDYVRTLDVGDTVTLVEVLDVVGSDRGAESAYAVIREMNNKAEVAEAGIALLSVRGVAGVYRVATADELLNVATVHTARRLVNTNRTGMKRATATVNHPEGSVATRGAAVSALNRMQALDEVLKENRREMRRVAPEWSPVVPPIPVEVAVESV